MRKWMLGLLVVPLALMLWGAHGLVLAWKCRAPLELTYAQYLQKKPVHGWLRLKDVRMDLRRAAPVPDRSGVVHEFFVPLEPVSTASSEKWPVEVVLASRDAEAAAIVDQITFMEKNRKLDMLVDYVARNRESVVRVRDVEGFAQPDPPGGTGMDRKTLRGLGKFEEDYVVLVEGTRPTFEVPLGAVMLGLLALGVFYVVVLSPAPDAPAGRGSRAHPSRPLVEDGPPPRSPRPRGSGPAPEGASPPRSGRSPSGEGDEPRRGRPEPEPVSAAEAELLEILREAPPPRRSPRGDAPGDGLRRPGGSSGDDPRREPPPKEPLPPL